MRHEYNLDHLITYDVEEADGDRLVPCPRYKDKCKEISRMKADLKSCKKIMVKKPLRTKKLSARACAASTLPMPVANVR